jgi:pyridoxamine 5'-phosphate oxidase
MIEFNASDPFGLFRQWMADAEKSEPEDPNAMALATADASGVPSVRMVLLKGIDDRGFVFYTNLESRKGVQLAENPNAALCFHWKSLRRQVRVEGPVEAVTDAEADEYYHSRPRGSQIGAWASRQSRPLEGRWELEKRVAEFTAKHAIGTIPRPPHWSGFRVVPSRIEFWHDRPFRLHDRVVFHRTGDAGPGGEAGVNTGIDKGWTTERLFP